MSHACIYVNRKGIMHVEYVKYALMYLVRSKIGKKQQQPFNRKQVKPYECVIMWNK